jgi:DNA-binding MarR family transcriptional regulator
VAWFLTSIMFNSEQYCTRMNKKQDPAPSAPAAPSDAVVPWELPRFRNWVSVAKVHALVEKAMSAGLAPLELRLPHYDILANVYRYPGLTQQELADRMLVGRSNLSMLLPELERRGLVDRTADAGDRRLRRLSLTPAGAELTRRALAVHVALIEDMMRVLSAEECEALGDAMRRIGRHMAEAR